MHKFSLGFHITKYLCSWSHCLTLGPLTLECGFSEEYCQACVWVTPPCDMGQVPSHCHQVVKSLQTWRTGLQEEHHGFNMTTTGTAELWFYIQKITVYVNSTVNFVMFHLGLYCELLWSWSRFEYRSLSVQSHRRWAICIIKMLENPL